MYRRRLACNYLYHVEWQPPSLRGGWFIGWRVAASVFGQAMAAFYYSSFSCSPGRVHHLAHRGCFTIYRTTAIVFDGSLWPALLIALTRYSSCTPRGWPFNVAVVSSEIAVCFHLFPRPVPRPIPPSPISFIVRSRRSMI